MFGSRGLSGMTIDSIHGLCIVGVSLLKTDETGSAVE